MLNNHSTNSGKAVNVLFVEDDSSDIELTKETLEASKIVINLNIVTDGSKAMAYLQKKDEYISAVRPDLILLDLNLPKKDGREVLREIKNDVALKNIPVIIFTTSSAEEDVLNTYREGANCYITKPVGLAQFAKVIHIIEDFWFTIVNLPHC